MMAARIISTSVFLFGVSRYSIKNETTDCLMISFDGHIYLKIVEFPIGAIK